MLFKLTLSGKFVAGGSRETLRQGDILVPKGDLNAVAACLNK